MRQVEIDSKSERRRMATENEGHRIEIENDGRQTEMQHDLEFARSNAAHVIAGVQNSAGSGASSSGKGAGNQRLDLLISAKLVQQRILRMSRSFHLKLIITFLLIHRC